MQPNETSARDALHQEHFHCRDAPLYLKVCKQNGSPGDSLWQDGKLGAGVWGLGSRAASGEVAANLFGRSLVYHRTQRVGRLFGGPRVGFLALTLMTITPVYYGHMFINPKDIPFACGMVWSLYLMCRAVELLPRVPLKYVLLLGAVFGITLGVLAMGVEAGIGRTASFFIPLLVVAFTILVVRSLFLPGAAEGLDALFSPQWSALTDTGVWVSAFGQIFFSL